MRPDLSRILPQPLTQRLSHGLGEALSVPAAIRAPDYVLDVDPDRRPRPGDAGFGIQQARNVAERLARRLGGGNVGLLHAPEPGRAARLLS